MFTVEQGIAFKTMFNKVGYKHPSAKTAKNYSQTFREVGAGDLDSDNETVIIHFGINQNLNPGFRALSVVSEAKSGAEQWKVKRGEVAITNKRMVVFNTGGFLRGESFGYNLPLEGYKRLDPTEMQNRTRFQLIGDNHNLTLEMQFISITAVLLSMSQAFGGGSSSSKSYLDYIKSLKSEQDTRQLANALSAQANNIKQAMYQFFLFMVE